MNQEELNEVIVKHKKWLNNEIGGERAVLNGVNLSGSDLRDSDLRDSDLRDSNLSCSNLSGSDLRDSDLSNSDLRNSDLRDSNLSCSNLSGSDLRCSNLRGSDLRGSDLRDSDLRGSDLSDSNLRGSDLSDSDLDYSSFPLWCGGLDVHIDDRIAIQLLYHLVRNVQYSKNTSEELKLLLGSAELISKANEFHRTQECGKITIKGGERNEPRSIK